MIEAISSNPKESRKEWLLHMFKFFAHKYGEKQEYQFWQQGNHPVSLNNLPKRFSQKVNYIHNNPVKARMVDEAEHYPWCSAYPLNRVKLVDY